VSSPFVAEIRIFGFNFAPIGWAFCDGQLMPLSQNTALFSLLGTMYGGDGKSTFALPDLQDSAVMHFDQGVALSEHFQGEVSGTSTVTLVATEIPSHNHILSVSTAQADEEGSKAPGNNVLGRGQATAKIYDTFPPVAPANTVTLDLNALGVAGDSLPHNNMMPSLALNFCIALQGVFPART
jgi:microcystin-dependent protein